jgi:hypothetical protein
MPFPPPIDSIDDPLMGLSPRRVDAEKTIDEPKEGSISNPPHRYNLAFRRGGTPASKRCRRIHPQSVQPGCRVW